MNLLKTDLWDNLSNCCPIHRNILRNKTFDLKKSFPHLLSLIWMQANFYLLELFLSPLWFFEAWHSSGMLCWITVDSRKTLFHWQAAIGFPAGITMGIEWPYCIDMRLWDWFWSRHEEKNLNEVLQNFGITIWKGIASFRGSLVSCWFVIYLTAL